MSLVAGARQPLGAIGDRARERLLRGAAKRLGLGALGLRIGREAETLQLADMMALDHHVARRRDLGLQHRILPEAAHQHARPPIDETLDQALVQRVGQTVLDRLAFHRATWPVRQANPADWRRRSRCGSARCGPRACRCRLRCVGARGSAPAIQSSGTTPPSAMKRKDLADQLGMLRRGDLAVVGQPADVPEPPHAVRPRARSAISSSRASASSAT